MQYAIYTKLLEILNNILFCAFKLKIKHILSTLSEWVRDTFRVFWLACYMTACLYVCMFIIYRWTRGYMHILSMVGWSPSAVVRAVFCGVFSETKLMVSNAFRLRIILGITVAYPAVSNTNTSSIGSTCWFDKW